MNLELICIDFESYYDRDIGYTLKKITGEEYVRSDLFEALCVGVATDKARYWVPQESLGAFFANIPWGKIAVAFHHAQFDALILQHVFGYSPKLIVDTLSMTRAMNFPRDMSLSLESLSTYYKLPQKTVPYNLFHGKRWADMDAGLKRQLGEGAARDAENTLVIAKECMKTFPREELISIDWTVRAYTQPQLVGNTEGFAAIAANEEMRKQALLDNLGLTRKDLASNDKFASTLEALGVEVEKKANSKGELIPAVAKSDSFMKELLEHEDALIVDLAETRLAVKSTIRETRAGRMAAMSSRGKMCTYYYYCGAQNTTRHSGGDKFNWQNLERKGPMRQCIEAPDGFMLIIADKSQIECRMLNTAAGQWDVAERFARNEDVYSYNASVLYGHEVSKESHPEKRGTGKQIELSCGYGCGAPKFQATAALGTYGPAVNMSLDEATEAVSMYRETHHRVVDSWDVGKYILKQWAAQGIEGTAFELMGVLYKDGLAHLPNGLKLDYRTTQWDSVLGQHFFHHKKSFARNVDSEAPLDEAERWQWWYRKGYRKLYGGKMVEQLTQALSAVDYRQTCNRLYVRYGLRPAMSSHDEAVYVVPEDEAEYWREVVHKEFASPPVWLPRMPAAAEVTISKRYTK